MFHSERTYYYVRKSAYRMLNAVSLGKCVIIKTLYYIKYCIYESIVCGQGNFLSGNIATTFAMTRAHDEAGFNQWEKAIGQSQSWIWQCVNLVPRSIGHCLQLLCSKEYWMINKATDILHQTIKYNLLDIYWCSILYFDVKHVDFFFKLLEKGFVGTYCW